MSREYRVTRVKDTNVYQVQDAHTDYCPRCEREWRALLHYAHERRSVHPPHPNDVTDERFALLELDLPPRKPLIPPPTPRDP